MRGYVFTAQWQKKVYESILMLYPVVVTYIKEIIKREKVARRLSFIFEKVYEKDCKLPFNYQRNFYINTSTNNALDTSRLH